jgi:hypothetical protein
MLLRPRGRTGGDWEIQSVAKPTGGAKKETANTERQSKNTRRNSDLMTQEGTLNATKVFLLKLNKNLYNHEGHRPPSLI